MSLDLQGLLQTHSFCDFMATLPFPCRLIPALAVFARAAVLPSSLAALLSAIFVEMFLVFCKLGREEVKHHWGAALHLKDSAFTEIKILLGTCKECGLGNLHENMQRIFL